MRIRIEILVKDAKFEGVIEMDEIYFGGKARKKTKRSKCTGKQKTVTN